MIDSSTKRLVKLIQISLYAVFASGSRNPVDQTYANASSRDGIYAIPSPAALLPGINSFYTETEIFVPDLGLAASPVFV